MAVIDLVGQRWVLRIIWELRHGPLNFRALQKACDGLSPSVLNLRLAELRDALILDIEPEKGYALTMLGRELLKQLQPLKRWAEKWANAIA